MLIACSRATVISPVIDVINEHSFKYVFVNTVLGSFTWKLSFTWTTLLRSMQTGDPSDPVKLVDPHQSITTQNTNKYCRFWPGLEDWEVVV